ncbi:spondin domain-containing protein [Flavobacteriaceae bacterium GSB9]|nr:spondin domain-containing protein [Flavobacteriaceae bacterium GSB9]
MKKTTLLFYLLVVLAVNVVQGQSMAVYDIVFESVWESVDNNPTDGISTISLPSNAHWSSMVLVTHKTANTFLTVGAKASSGIELIAEEGDTSTFEDEVNANNDANKIIVGNGLSSAKGTIAINNVVISEDFALITLASMIAPSPDWFIAVNSENLRSGNQSINNGWKSTLTIDLYPYDAGTEDGNTYSLNNPATNPIGNISSLSNVFPFNDKKIGTVTFTYNSSTLSTENALALTDLKIFPNPAKDNITISNIESNSISSVKIYTVVGKLIKQIENLKQEEKQIKIDLTTLKRGVYLLNVKGTLGENFTQKLIIN